MDLFDLFFKIGVKDEASEKISTLSSKLGSGLKTAAKFGVAAVGAITTATAAAATAFSKGISNVAEYGDNIDKMSQKMGISAKAYQEWDFVMQHNGTSMETLKAGMKTLANAVDSGNDAFQRLGISQKEISKLNQEELFERTISALQNVEDETERTYLAGQLLGRGATELGALLNMTAEETKSMKKQASDLGGVMSNKAVKSAAAFQDSLQNLQTSFQGISRGMLSEFLPSITEVMDGLSLIFSGDDSGIGKISSGIGDFADNLFEVIPKIFELGSQIVSNLTESIIDNLPTLTSASSELMIELVGGIIGALPDIVDSAIQIIQSLTQGLIENLPKITESSFKLVETLVNGILQMLPDIIKLGLDLIVSLANGLAKYLPELIPAVIKVVLKIVETLTNPSQLANIINAALRLILALVNGLLNSNALSNLMKAAIQIIMNLVNYLLNPRNISNLISSAIKIVAALVKGIIGARLQMANAALQLIQQLISKFKNTDWGSLGRNIVSGLLNGLKSSWSSIKSWFSRQISGLVSSAKSLLGIHSPSTVFAGIGKNMVLGLKGGWEDTFDKAKKTINDSLDFNSNVSYKLGRGGLDSELGGYKGINIVQNIYSKKQTAAEIMQEARWQAKMGVLTNV